MSNPAKALQFGFVLSNTHYLYSVATSEAAPRGDCRFRRNRDAVARTSCQKPIGFVLQNKMSPQTFRGPVRYAQAGEHAERLNRQFQPNQVFKFHFKTRNR